LQASDKSTAFHLACGQGSLETVKLLANHDPSICRIMLIDFQGQTPLHKAAANDHVHVVEYLLDQVKVVKFQHISFYGFSFSHLLPSVGFRRVSIELSGINSL